MRTTMLLAVFLICLAMLPLGAHCTGISDAKILPDNSPVTLSARVVTYASADFFYIEEDSRCMGIRVEKIAHGLTAGIRADVVGAMNTNTDRERYILASSAVQTAPPNANGAVAPVGMNNRALGGGNWSVVGTGGQQGVTGAIGLNNIGLLVRTTGAVAHIDEHTFTVDDGSGVNIRCETPSTIPVSEHWEYVTVTGIGSINGTVEATYERLLRVTEVETLVVNDELTAAEAAVVSEIENLPTAALSDILLPDGRSVQEVLDTLSTNVSGRSLLSDQPTPSSIQYATIALMVAQANCFTDWLSWSLITGQANGLAYNFGSKDPYELREPSDGHHPERYVPLVPSYRCHLAVYGLDCSGLVYQAAIAAGMSFAETRPEYINADLESQEEKWVIPPEWGLTMQEVDNTSPGFKYQTGDIVSFGSPIYHIGIVEVVGNQNCVVQSGGSPCYSAPLCLNNRSSLCGPKRKPLADFSTPPSVLRLVPRIEMIYIPGGSFLMGNSNVGNDAHYHLLSELPQHSVNLAAYYIGKYDVKRGEYAQFMNAGGYSNPAYWSSAGWSWKGSRTEPSYWAASQDWGTGTFTQTDNHPVVGVTYYEAEAFCNWAGGHLPTEAQWEKAARWDGHPRIHPWGDTWDVEKCNNYSDRNAAGGGYQKHETSPVGSYPSGASPYGCQDMVGNVWQWVQDWYKSYPGSTSPFDYTNSFRGLRGGSCFSSGYYHLRCANRNYYAPNCGNVDFGFRLAR